MRCPVLVASIPAILLLAGCLREPVAGDPAATMPGVSHTVAAGETLTQLARAYGVEMRVIIDANRLASPQLVPGTILVIPGGRASPAPPAEPPAEPAAPPPQTAWYLPRSAWTQSEVVRSRATPMGGTPYRITVHHSGDGSHVGKEPFAWLRMVEDRHQAGHSTGAAYHQPWAAIGYHFIILQDGRVIEGRPLAWQGAHVGGDANRRNIGICLVGDFDRSAPGKAQIDALVRTLDELREEFRIARDAVFGHRDFKATECPGERLYPLLEAYRNGRLTGGALVATQALQR